MKNTIKTLALLKVTFDHHQNIQDYLDIFIPLLITLIKNKKIKSLNDTKNICEAFFNEYGLSIPYHPMLAILKKAIQKGYATEVSKGEFVPVFDKINSDEISSVSLEQEHFYQLLINRYISFSKKTHDIELSQDEASRHIIALLEDHDIDLVFVNEGRISVLPQVDTKDININLPYDFVREMYEQDYDTFQLIADISFGHIIASSILYSYDLPKSKGIENVNYYLDIGILFGLVGIDGDDQKMVFENFIKSLGTTGGRIYIFNHTYNEFINILDTSKNWIDNPNYDPYKANRSLARFKSWGFHVTDIDLFIAKLPKLFSELNIERVDSPDPNEDKDYQLSDIDLQKKIIEVYKENYPYFDEEQKEGTIYLDVKSISAIYKLRKGCYPRLFEECSYLFVTRNSTLAYASKQFELSINNPGRFFIPTTVTDIFVGTIIWLNSPLKINLEDANKKHLIANCYAALQPSRQLKRLFLAEVDKAASDNLLSDDEVNLLKNSYVAQTLLQEKTLGDATKVTGATPVEIANEIKARAKKEAQQEYEEYRKAHDEQVRLAELSLIENEEELKKREIDNELTLATLKKEKESKEKLISEIKKRVKTNASRSSWVIFAVFTLIFIVLQFAQSFNVVLPINIVILTVSKIISVIISILGGVVSFNLWGLKEFVFAWLVKKELKSYGLENDNITNS